MRKPYTQTRPFAHAYNRFVILSLARARKFVYNLILFVSGFIMFKIWLCTLFTLICMTILGIFYSVTKVSETELVLKLFEPFVRSRI